MKAIEPGIRRTGSGWEVYVRIAGELRSKHFPPDTDLRELRGWRERQKARRLLGVPIPAIEGSLARDVPSYLAVKTGMPSYKDRAHRMNWWLATLGPERSRADITSLEIRQQLERRRKAGDAHATLNNYRTALMDFYTVLDGKAGRNPVRDVPRYRESPKAFRMPTWAEAERAIAAVGWKRRTKGGWWTHATPRTGTDGAGNLTRVRLRILLWTGLPASLLGRLTARDVKWTAGLIHVPARLKGRGMPAKTVPALPQAIAALRDLRRLNGFGPFDTSSMHKALARGCQAARVPAFHPYALKYLFQSAIAQASKDDRAARELSRTQQSRYTDPSVDPRLVAALTAFQRARRAR